MTPYGQIILSKFPFGSSIVPFSAAKRAVVANFTFTDSCGVKSTLIVPCIHLTSARGSGDVVKTRRTQLSTLEQYISAQLVNLADSSRKTSCLLVGDFNFGDGPENEVLPTKYIDVWPALEDCPGYTYDPIGNTMAAVTTNTGLKKRFDRILIDSTEWSPASVNLIGNEPHTLPHSSESSSSSSSSVVLYPSDHYGVVCTIIPRKNKSD